MFKRRWFQFSLSWLLRTVSIYGLAFGTGVLAALTPLQMAISVAILTAFVGVEVTFFPPVRAGVPFVASAARIVAFYATAFAFAVAGSAAAFLFTFPSSLPTSRSTGLDAAAHPLVTTIVLILFYLGAFSFFSAIAFIFSFPAVRHFRVAWWLVAINAPGFLVFCILLVQLVRMALSGDLEIADP